MVNLRKKLSFCKDESGAVTVDWVVLTAALVLVGVAAVAIYKPALSEAATDISDAITDSAIGLNPVATT